MEIINESNINDQYDKFLYQVQQAKMKELWNNEEDEVWGRM